MLHGYAVHVMDCARKWVACFLSWAIYTASFFKEIQTFSVEVFYIEDDDKKEDKNGDYLTIKWNKDEKEDE